ncbi:interleukin-6 receptor subunit beta isoform X2 [Callithrix jacchus]|uniref:interleukin-6 receptor subunit beta isoform X2 n=1 Tax=Callithrix jacchus TaxID=9483 RepID=UPI0023DD28E5|nr:interleukin-6 receptor subunit beta isoform X2 [Callithrix jacchus]XP_054102577.1 interleukin-6 receptor subunit beta isoform X2 [Callithrix jacchus]
MLMLRTWLVQALFIFLTTESIGELLDPCGHISPESPVVQLHSNFTAVCVLKEKCMDYFHVNANYIFWKTNHFTIPKEQYTIINRTASSVTFTDIASLNIQLTCNILTFGQIEQNVYGITVISGLPPEKPENLSCIVNEGKRMMCQWDPGRETHLETNFTLKSEWATHKFPDCIAKRDNPTSCTVDYSTVYFVNIEVWVEAENALGNVTSDHINFDPVYKVKPNPPHNLSVINSEELSSILKLTWTNPGIKSVITLKYNIQYRTKDASTWSQIPPEDTASTRSSFTVQDLKPFTEYVFRIRCMKEDGKGYWSDWSEEASGITYEDRPSKAPSFWYKIDPSHTHGYRTVQLLWKTLPPFEANGKILDYEVTLTRWKSRLQDYIVNDTKLTVNLTNDRYVATLTARNLVGKSDAAVLTIPACDFQATRPVMDLKAFPKDNMLWVEWTTPRESVKKYVLEWCVLSDKSPCITDWQQEDGTVHRTYLRGNLAESKCYLITVTPVYADGPGSPESIKAYLKQAPPSKGPTVRTKKVGKNEAVLEWDQLPVDVQNGFIRNYTIFYRTIIGNETAVNVDSSHTEYTLSSLTSDTLYMVRMAAYTDEGGKDGPEFTFTTPKFESLDEILTRITSLEKNIKDLMELKNTAQELHEAYTSFNSRINQAEERISEIEDQLNEIKREVKIREKRVKRNEQSLQETWDYVKRPNLRLIGIPECDGENETKLENTLQDIIQENFPILASYANIQIQEIQRMPRRYSSRRTTPRHIIVRFVRVEMKEKILRAAREKGRVTHKGKPIRLTADLSAETL